MSLPNRVFAARCAFGRPATKTDGSARADTNGTRSTRAGCAQLAFISGRKRSACRAATGRLTPSGIVEVDLGLESFKFLLFFFTSAAMDKVQSSGGQSNLLSE